MKSATVEGEDCNIKLTLPQDLRMAERLLNNGTSWRTGLGFDVHAFAPERQLILCGVRIPHELGLTGHSDADVAFHAITDAILGTIAAGDIGSHFPPSDPQWRDADSTHFLRHAAALLAERGGRIENVDLVIVCERPKIGPHRAAMAARTGEVLGIAADRVQHQGHDQRAPGLHRTRRRHRSPGGGQRGAGGMNLTSTFPPACTRLAKALLEACSAKDMRLATAESCTGGLIVGCLTDIAGSSSVVDRGYVTYDDRAKVEMLGVGTDDAGPAWSGQRDDGTPDGRAGRWRAPVVTLPWR